MLSKAYSDTMPLNIYKREELMNKTNPLPRRVLLQLQILFEQREPKMADGCLRKTFRSLWPALDVLLKQRSKRTDIICRRKRYPGYLDIRTTALCFEDLMNTAPSCKQQVLRPGYNLILPSVSHACNQRSAFNNSIFFQDSTKMSTIKL